MDTHANNDQFYLIHPANILDHRRFIISWYTVFRFIGAAIFCKYLFRRTPCCQPKYLSVERVIFLKHFQFSFMNDVKIYAVVSK